METIQFQGTLYRIVENWPQLNNLQRWMLWFNMLIFLTIKIDVLIELNIFTGKD